MSMNIPKTTTYFYAKKYYNPLNNEVFFRKYSRSFECGKNAPVKRTDGVKSNVTQSSLSRAKSTVRLLAFYNPDLTGFLTLTFKDIPSEEVANLRFKNFIRRCRYLYKNFKFLGVKELQKRGAIHYHLLVNFCPGLSVSPNNPKKYICTAWLSPIDFNNDDIKYGWSDYAPYDPKRNLDGNFSLQLYLFKYLTKNNQKLFSTYYVRSRNLNKPLEPIYLDSNRGQSPTNAKNIVLRNISYKKDGKSLATLSILEYTYFIKHNLELKSEI